jgi:tetratricopeptide (TPR) repeat protein
MGGMMDRDKSSSKPLALEPIEPPASKSDAEGELGSASAHVQTADEEAKAPDKFLAAAIREYAKGRVNQQLWASIASKTGGDEKATRSAYLVARATELRLAVREQKSHAAAGEAALPKPKLVQIDGGARAAKPSSVPAGRDRRRVYIGVAAALIAFIVAGSVALMRAGGDDAKGAMATIAPKSAKASAAAKKEPEKPADPSPRENIEAKVRAFADAGNWNMLVIFANEWTRVDPSNVAAWLELSRGYTKMSQLDEAVRAAKKTVELAPQDASLWRNLAQIEGAASNPDGAVRAYERATVLDPKDVDSLVQIGIVHVKSDRMPQARAAFDRALAANPANVDALCGQQFVAQRDNRAKDADALAKQLRAVDGKCRDFTEGATIAVKHPGAVTTPAR